MEPITKDELKEYLSFGLSDCMFDLERLVISRYFRKVVGFTEEQITEMHKDIEDIYNKYPRSCPLFRGYDKTQEEAMSLEIDEYLTDAFNSRE